jgi:hypothetical protein
MKYLLDHGARVEDTNDYLATFQLCSQMFGKQKGLGLSRQEIDFQHKLKIKSVASIITIITYLTLPQIFEMRRLSIYFAKIVDTRLLMYGVSNQQIPHNQTSRRLYITIPHSPSLFMLANERSAVNGDMLFNPDFSDDLLWRSLSMVRQSMVYKRKFDRVKLVMKPFEMNKCENPVFVQSKQNTRCVYMIGGLEKREEGSKLMYEINYETGMMRKKPSMSIGRFAFAACAIRHYIVVVGGLERTLLSITGTDLPNGIKDCLIYNTITEKWHKLPPLPVDRIQPSVVTVNERFIFVIGGLSYVNDIFCYDLAEFNESAPERQYDSNGFPFNLQPQDDGMVRG